ncbi:homoserine dehydrogenase [Chromatiales bacterium (ex Bugula neritina AB1)]|nr:homoserine dehydrogenase [Chromatiales bacterium (ex Bugula neritina AB1)]
MKPVKIGFLGFGTVGQGAAVVLARNANEISRRAGRQIIVKSAVVRDINRTREAGLEEVKLSTDPLDVVNDPEIDVVVEVMGGDEPSRTLLLQAIANGKHVVTANKALIARFGNELFEAARERSVSVAFEAAVAGGIPVIKSIREGLAGNKIHWLAGIINGTSNYILSEMRDKGRDFSDVLQEAQELGYAEADPTFDVEGVDAAHKLTILASIAFGVPLNFDAVYIEGISGISREDTAYAEELGYRIKHLGIARDTGGGIELRVHPTLIPERRLIANVDGVMNAILVQADAVGPTLYYGAGAGAEPTGSSIVADIMDAARGASAAVDNRVPHLAFQHDALSEIRVASPGEFETSFYLRIQVDDKPGVMADISRILAEEDISIEAIIQKEPAAQSTTVPIILLTRKIVEGAMDAAISKIEALSSVEGEVKRIRVESLG